MPNTVDLALDVNSGADDSSYDSLCYSMSIGHEPVGFFLFRGVLSLNQLYHYDIIRIVILRTPLENDCWKNYNLIQIPPPRKCKVEREVPPSSGQFSGESDTLTELAKRGRQVVAKYLGDMSHATIPSGFVKSVLQNGVGRYVCQLQRLTLVFCKSSADSRGLR